MMEPAFYEPKPKRCGPVMPSLFDAVYPTEEPETPLTDKSKVGNSRIEEVRESNASKHRADIERGKPIAVIVANRDGKVIAETFREEASRRRVVFDSGPDEQRGFCWIPTMFGELCKEGKLDLRVHPNGKPDKEYSKAQHNDQNVYTPATRREDAA